MSLISKFKKIRFFESLQPAFQEHHFEFVPMLNQFRKMTDSGFKNIIINPSIYPDFIYFELTFGTRIDIVEETITPYITGLRGFKAECNTAVTSLSKYLKKPYFRLKAESERELEDVIRFVIRFFEREGLSFLQSLEDINILEAAFNNEPEKESLVAFDHELRSFRGLTLATMVQNPRWNELREIYLENLIRHNSPSLILENYNRLIRFLSDLGLN